jgi:D-alanyl-lipoteichoic acid acyltransferase DltB (MBOAT superfamily)
MLGAIDVWTLAFLFGFQIYFDFAAYSQIAIGSARLMGIHFPQNFNFPYLACSPKDFWRRWHISLSSWVRDYLYLPLCGVPVGTGSTGGLSVATQARSSVSNGRRSIALFVSWALMGLWHGPAWAFVLWGVWHAAMVYGYRRISPLITFQGPLRTILGWACTTSLAMLAWIPFRAVDLRETLTMLGKLIQPSQYFDVEIAAHGHLPTAIPHNLDPSTYYAMLLMLILMFAAAATRRWVFPMAQKMSWTVLPGRVLAYAVMTAGVFIYLRPIRQFIYFQF